MSIEKVQERIITIAKEKASQLIAEEEKKISLDREVFLEGVRREFINIKEKRLAELEMEFKRKVDKEHLKTDREILFTKTAILNDVFENALNTLVSISADVYLNFLKKLLLRDVIKEGCEIFLNKNDYERVCKELMRFVESKFGKNVSLNKTTVDIKGGCIIKGKEVEFDDSIESIVTDLRDKLEVELSKELFEEGL